ncbi:MAG: MFS transporter small subunit, partial [Janthinobacterium lividum]
RLLTAWSTAGIVGPIVITQIPEMQMRAGVARGTAYAQTLYILAGFLVVGFVCNLLIRPVADRWFMRETSATGPSITTAPVSASYGIGRGGFSITALLAWSAVGIPLVWGIWVTLTKALVLFR